METSQLYQNGLRVMAEYASSGIWAICLPGERAPFRHQMISHQTLGLPEVMTTRFECWVADCSQWLEWKRGYQAVSRPVEELNAEGRLLAQALKLHVGEGFPVVYAPVDNPRIDELVS